MCWSSEFGAIFLKLTYGYTVDQCGNDPMVNLADRAMHEFSLVTQAGAWLVDSMPIRECSPPPKF